jgi:hypothetical protein
MIFFQCAIFFQILPLRKVEITPQALREQLMICACQYEKYEHQELLPAFPAFPQKTFGKICRLKK